MNATLNRLQVTFRADASSVIGTGHVMRCLALARELRACGARCRFVSREHPGHLLGRVREQGFEAIGLPLLAGDDMAPDDQPAHSAWLGAPWAVDADQTREALNGRPSDWLIVDHYGIDARWESALRGSTRRLMVIDDLADRPHDADLLLDQNLTTDAEARYRALVPPACQLRLGPAHVLLRPEFDHVVPRTHHGAVQRVFVYFGGNDRFNLAGQVLAALRRLPQLQADIVLGADHPHRDAVHAAAAGQSQVQVLDTTDDMVGLMARADLALGVCGMAAWERCAVGLPSLVCINADNQRADSLALQALGAADCLGEAEALCADDWFEALARAHLQPDRIARMAAQARHVVAGHTANRQSLLQLLLLSHEPHHLAA